MGIVFMVVVLLALVFGPGLWVRRVIERYSNPPDRYSGTGAQLARFLLNKLDMQHVTVETTDQGDHYDPTAKAVRLTPDKYEGRSLTAITVAAHEVGHAIQHAHGYAPLKFRSGWVPVANLGGGLSMFALIAALFMGGTATVLGHGLALAGVLLLGAGSAGSRGALLYDGVSWRPSADLPIGLYDAAAVFDSGRQRAVVVSRYNTDLYESDGGDPPAMRIEPGDWYLVIGRHGFQARVQPVDAALWRLLDACGQTGDRRRSLAGLIDDPALDGGRLGELVERGWLGNVELRQHAV